MDFTVRTRTVILRLMAIFRRTAANLYVNIESLLRMSSSFFDYGGADEEAIARSAVPG